MSCFSSFDRLCRKIVMPTRHQINDKDMIDRKFRGLNPPYQLLTITNNRNRRLSTLIFHKDPASPTILYLHGNGGNKIEVLHLVKMAMDYPFNVAAFDFSACGKSQGEFLTYGEQEVDDIHAVVEHLKRNYRAKTIFLWGRSMGASLGLLYGERYPNSVRGMVLDSPFRSLEKIVYNVAASTQSLLPNFLVKIGVFFVKENVESIVGYNIFNLDYSLPFQKLALQRIPLLFAFSTRDNVVLQEDVMEMYFLYNGPKRLSQFNCREMSNVGLHPEDRPKQFINEAMEFMSVVAGVERSGDHERWLEMREERGTSLPKTSKNTKEKYSMANLRNRWNNI